MAVKLGMSTPFSSKFTW